MRKLTTAIFDVLIYLRVLVTNKALAGGYLCTFLGLYLTISTHEEMSICVLWLGLLLLTATTLGSSSFKTYKSMLRYYLSSPDKKMRDKSQHYCINCANRAAKHDAVLLVKLKKLTHAKKIN